jgi:protein-tyrosine-phosphatase
MPLPEPDRPEAFRLLFVCTGNTCRSPLAEALARQEADRRGWSHLEVASAGVSAASGESASEGALRVASRHGLPLDAHRSRPLDAELTERADLILVMSPGHLRRVEELGAGERAALVDAFAHPEGGEGRGGAGVPDPFGGDDEAYEDTYQSLAGLVRDALDRLEAILAP